MELNLKADAERLLNDPEYLRRKAVWIREQAKRGGPHTEDRIARALVLEARADELDGNHE